MHEGKQYQKRCQTLEQAIAWRSEKEMHYQHKLQPAIIKWKLGETNERNQ